MVHYRPGASPKELTVTFPNVRKEFTREAIRTAIFDAMKRPAHDRVWNDWGTISVLYEGDTEAMRVYAADQTWGKKEGVETSPRLLWAILKCPGDIVEIRITSLGLV